MQKNYIKVKSKEEAAFVVSAVVSLSKKNESSCMYRNDDPKKWGSDLFEHGYHHIKYSDGGVAGSREACGSFKFEEIDQFLLSIFGDLREIPDNDEKKKKTKHVKASCGVIKIDQESISLPSIKLTVDDVEDIAFALKN